MAEPPDITVTDNVHITAHAFASMGPLPESAMRDRLTLEEKLNEINARIVADDFSGLKNMLACQAQLLHHMFAHAASKCVAGATDEQVRQHGSFALKAQSCCRMTVNSINALKSKPLTPSQLKNLQNELIRQNRHASLDR